MFFVGYRLSWATLNPYEVRINMTANLTIGGGEKARNLAFPLVGFVVGVEMVGRAGREGRRKRLLLPIEERYEILTLF